MLTEQELSEIEARENELFSEHARTDVPALIADWRKMRAALDKAEEALDWVRGVSCGEIQVAADDTLGMKHLHCYAGSALTAIRAAKGGGK